MRQADPLGLCVPGPTHPLPSSTRRLASYPGTLGNGLLAAATPCPSPPHPPRPNCCVARSSLRHTDPSALAWGIPFGNAVALAPLRSKKTSSALLGKHATFVASLTAPATDRWHSRAKRSIECVPRAIHSCAKPFLSQKCDEDTLKVKKRAETVTGSTPKM